jgi:hypothetical protein
MQTFVADCFSSLAQGMVFTAVFRTIRNHDFDQFPCLLELSAQPQLISAVNLLCGSYLKHFPRFFQAAEIPHYIIWVCCIKTPTGLLLCLSNSPPVSFGVCANCFEA